MDVLGAPVIEWSAAHAAYWREAQEHRAAALAEEAHLLALDCVGLQSFARLCEVEEARILLDGEMEQPPPTVMVDMGTGPSWTSVLLRCSDPGRSTVVLAGSRHGRTRAAQEFQRWRQMTRFPR